MKFLTVNDVIRMELDRIGLTIAFSSSPKHIRANPNAKIEITSGLEVPLIGGLTELENLLFKWVSSKKQLAATKLYLCEMQLADMMIRELDISEEDSKLAIATALQAINGEVGGEYRFVKWLIAHSADLEGIVQLAHSWDWHYCRLLTANIFLSSRIDPNRDFSTELMNSNTLLADVESFIQQETGGIVEEKLEEVKTADQYAEEVSEEGIKKS